MKGHTPYTEEDWHADTAARKCPDCGSSNDYGPRKHPKADGSLRRYRMCKRCGFTQEADGSAPYRCFLTVHHCVAEIQEGDQCTSCPKWGPVNEHDCARVLAPKEIKERSYRHDVCGTVLGEEHVIHWPLRGSD